MERASGDLTNPFSGMDTIIVGLQAMNVTKICRFFIIFMLLCTVIVFTNNAEAQKTYFVYLQSDNQQPFYVILNGKTVSSTPLGYVILSKLKDSTYPIRIGFPKTEGEQEFDLKIDGGDHGFLLKDFAEKGFGLFNLQTLAVQMNSGDAKKKAADLATQAEMEKKRTDSLNVVAAQVAAQQKADSIKQALAIQEEAKKNTEENTATAATAVPAPSKATTTTGETASAIALKGIPAPLAGTLLYVESKLRVETADSAIMTKQLLLHDTAADVPGGDIERAIDTSGVAKEDTGSKKDVVMAVPVITSQMNDEPAEKTKKRAADSSKKASADPGTVAVVGAAATAPKFLDMEMHTDSNETVPGKKAQASDSGTAKPVSETKTASNKPDTGSKKEAGLTSNNSNTRIVTVAGTTEPVLPASLYVNPACRQNANEKDFFAVRKKMAGTDDADEMVGVAKKAFKEKCFTSEQVRNLAVLFLDDAGRYNFLDAVYPYTSDQPNFKKLADLLKDDYYIKRFNAMLK